MENRKTYALKIQNIIILIGLSIASIVVIGLLIMLGKYDYKSVDDFWYSIHGEQCIREGMNFFGVAKEIWADTWDCYLTWQGTLFATFFTRMLESYIATKYYWLVVWIMIPAIVVPELYFAIEVIHKHYGLNLIATLNISLIFILLQLLTIPYPVEALYWLCGASYYTVFWGLSIVTVVLFLDVYWAEKKFSAKLICLCVLSVMVAFGNLISALVVFSAFAFVLFLSFIGKKNNRFYLLTAFVVFTICFLAEVLAPGNRIRVDDSSYLSPIMAVVYSFDAALQDVLWCVKMPFVWFVAVLMGIIVWPYIDAKKGKYKLPGLLVIVLFLLLTAHYVPSMYTLKIAGAGRIRNLERYFAFFFLYGSELYLLAYIKSIFAEMSVEIKMKKSRFPILLLLSLVLGGLTAGSLYKECNRTLTAYSAYISLRSGQAYRYMLQNEERIKILTDDNEPNPVINMFDDPPYLLLFRDAKDLEDVYEDYYGKESITVIEK